jgi:hypothetical protein
VQEINEGVLERLTSGHVEDTNIELERNSGLSLSQILAESLSAWPNIGTFSNLWIMNAGVVLDDFVVWCFSSVGVGCVGASGEVSFSFEVTLVVSLFV